MTEIERKHFHEIDLAVPRDGLVMEFVNQLVAAWENPQEGGFWLRRPSFITLIELELSEETRRGITLPFGGYVEVLQYHDRDGQAWLSYTEPGHPREVVRFQ